MPKVIAIGLIAVEMFAAQAPSHPCSGTESKRVPSSTGVITGTVKDNVGGIIRAAIITLHNTEGAVQTVTSGPDGSYSFCGLAPGPYSISATYAGLQQQGLTTVSVTARQVAPVNITMAVHTLRQELTVIDSDTATISTEAANNAGALVLRKEDLDPLPHDADDLQADLQALAGPAAGPGGNQIFIDGLTAGSLPPKESIREIRINSNPFSAEFDKLGYGRIQIFTKPGSDKFHGLAYYSISDGIWNSRNPFLVTSGADNPPFRTQLFGGNVSGPLSRHGSFFLDVERRNIDDNGIITAIIPAPNLLSHFSNQAYYSTPQRRTTVSPRVDYQLGANNTLSLVYSYLNNDRILTGIGGFDLPATTVGHLKYPSNGYGYLITENEFQAVETAVLSPRAINETRFKFDRESDSMTSQSLAPQLFVSQSFVAGGSGYSTAGFPHTTDTQNKYELQNYTSYILGTHNMKFGMRIRANVLDSVSPKGFNGKYVFLGGTFPRLGPNLQATGGFVQLQSIDQYLLTVRLLNSGLSSQQVTKLGYGPSKYMVNVGDPLLSLNQMDFGPFLQDDWNVRPNLRLSFGLRWESQTNIYDKNNWAPRFGFAWSPDAKGVNGRAKTIIRGGWGYFYDRFSITNVETAYRYNESNQIAYALNNPTIYDAAFATQIPLNNLITANTNPAQRYQIDRNLKTPRLIQAAVSVERQLFSRTAVNATFVNSRGTHELRTVDINAPYPVPGLPPPGAPGGHGIRPFGNVGDIYNFQSDGMFKEIHVTIGLRSQVGKWLTVFSRYSYINAHSNTDGLSTLPANPYNFAAEWGRSQLDIEHNVFVGGSIATRWGLRFSPFLVAHSGIPYNITTGTDLFLQGQATPTARPQIVNTPTRYVGPFGYLNPIPLVSPPGTSNMIARNAATGAGYLGLNLRVSKSWGFGTSNFSGPSGGARASRGGGGPSGERGFGGQGFGFERGKTTEHRDNLTLSINVRNILNHENLNTPNGALTSPYFMQSTGITGGYGAEATASNQRRLDFQLRFSF